MKTFKQFIFDHFSTILGIILIISLAFAVWNTETTDSYSGSMKVLRTEGYVKVIDDGNTLLYASEDARFSINELKALAKLSEQYLIVTTLQK